MRMEVVVWEPGESMNWVCAGGGWLAGVRVNAGPLTLASASCVEAFVYPGVVLLAFVAALVLSSYLRYTLYLVAARGGWDL